MQTNLTSTSMHPEALGVSGAFVYYGYLTGGEKFCAF